MLRAIRCSHGNRRVERLGAPADRPVGAGDDPWRGALEDGQPPHLRRDGRHELDRAGTGADDRDVAAGQVVVMPPAGRVEDRAGERLQAGDLRDPGLAQRPVASTRTSAVSSPVARPDPPALGRVVPGRLVSSTPSRRNGRRLYRSTQSSQVVPDLRLAARRPGSTTGWARTRTSRGPRARRRHSPGRCCPARSHRCSRPSPGRPCRARRTGAAGSPRRARRTRRRRSPPGRAGGAIRLPGPLSDLLSHGPTLPQPG